jgi:glutaredoxin
LTVVVNIGSILAVSAAIVGEERMAGYRIGFKQSGSLMMGTLLAGLVLVISEGCRELPMDIPLVKSYEAQLADHLSATGARMYGAYWCPYCTNQKRLFGGGSQRMPYVECDPQGWNAQSSLCQEKGIKVYPTWEIQGQFHEGVQPLGVLAELSGFRQNRETR